MNELTSRQQEIAGLAALGLSNGEIAVALRVTPGVVRAELEALYRQTEPQPTGGHETRGKPRTQPPSLDPMAGIDEQEAR